MAPSSLTMAEPTTPLRSFNNKLIAAATCDFLRIREAISVDDLTLLPRPARTAAARPLRSTIYSSMKRRSRRVSSPAHLGADVSVAAGNFVMRLPIGTQYLFVTDSREFCNGVKDGQRNGGCKRAGTPSQE